MQDSPATEYMSNRAYFEFVGIAAREEGIRDLGYRACMQVGRKRLSNELVARMEQSPTLYEALKAFCQGVRKDATHIRMGLVEEPDRVLYWQHSAPEAGSIGWDISEQLVTSIVVDVVRLFAGPQWCPRWIRSRAPLVPTECMEHLPRASMYGGGDRLVIPVPRTILHLPPLAVRAGFRSTTLPLSQPDDLPDALREILKGYLRNGQASLELAAEIVGTSTRTLQRQLKNSGTSYSRVLDQARYEVAARLLTEPHNQAIDVAYASGYSDPSNFSRAFRRMAGVSPSRYRSYVAGVK
jgi:AraC-like DNA-binding protein